MKQPRLRLIFAMRTQIAELRALRSKYGEKHLAPDSAVGIAYAALPAALDEVERVLEEKCRRCDDKGYYYDWSNRVECALCPVRHALLVKLARGILQMEVEGMRAGT